MLALQQRYHIDFSFILLQYLQNADWTVSAGKRVYLVTYGFVVFLSFFLFHLNYM